MSLGNLVLMPADNAVNPSTIPGASRKYSCAQGSAISVNGDDCYILRGQNWVGLGPGSAHWSSGATSTRPTTPSVGHVHVDTTLNIVAIYGGTKTAWMNAATGASV
jgi:hypothetical protein